MAFASRIFKIKILAFFIFLSIPSLFAQEYGLQLYSLRNQFAADAPGTMAKVKAMGFRNVEMAGTFGLPFPELIKLLAQNELNVVSFGADFDKLAKDPRAVADEARSYGAKFIVCFWVPHQDKFTVDDDRTIFDYMMEKLDQRYVYLELDVFWIKQAGQEPLNLLKKYSSRFVLLHLKDRKIGTPNTNNGKGDLESNVVLGTGDVGISEILREAKKLGIKHYFIEDESSKVEEQLPRSLAYLKSLQQ